MPNVDPLWVPMKEPVNDPVLTANVIDVAADAVVENEDVSAYEDEIALLAQLAVPKVDPLCVPMNDPVNEPVLTAKVIDVAAEAVVANEDVNAYDDELTVPFTNDAVLANEAVTGTNVIEVAAEAVVATDELIELLAQLAVPNVEPL